MSLRVIAGFGLHGDNDGTTLGAMPRHPGKAPAVLQHEHVGRTRGRRQPPPQSQSCLYYACEMIEAVDENGEGSVVKMDCSQANCPYSHLMHQSCYEKYEEAVLKVMRKTGRARSWSEQQRKTNLWLNGYDMVKKVCKCMCGKGLLRRDLDYVQPQRGAEKPRSSMTATSADPNSRSYTAAAVEDFGPKEADVLPKDDDGHLESCMYPACALCPTSSPAELSSVVKMDCSCITCPLGNLMHKSCCEEFEEQVLSYMRKTGRARAWTEQRRRNNLWANGYDLIKKVCKCRCGKGYLRRDISFAPPEQIQLLSPELTAAGEQELSPFNPDDHDDADPAAAADPWSDPAGPPVPGSGWPQQRGSPLAELMQSAGTAPVDLPVGRRVPSTSLQNSPTFGPPWASGLSVDGDGWSAAHPVGQAPPPPYRHLRQWSSGNAGLTRATSGPDSGATIRPPLGRAVGSASMLNSFDGWETPGQAPPPATTTARWSSGDAEPQQPLSGGFGTLPNPTAEPWTFGVYANGHVTVQRDFPSQQSALPPATIGFGLPPGLAQGYRGTPDEARPLQQSGQPQRTH